MLLDTSLHRYGKKKNHAALYNWERRYDPSAEPLFWVCTEPSATWFKHHPMCTDVTQASEASLARWRNAGLKTLPSFLFFAFLLFLETQPTTVLPSPRLPSVIAEVFVASPVPILRFTLRCTTEDAASHTSHWNFMCHVTFDRGAVTPYSFIRGFGRDGL